MNLIDEVIRLDKEATQGPWRWSDSPRTADGRESPSVIAGGGYGVLSCDGPENAPSKIADRETITLYRTAAPKLARALKVAMEALEQAIKNCETNGWDHEVPVDAIAEIEKELTNG